MKTIEMTAEEFHRERRRRAIMRRLARALNLSANYTSELAHVTGRATRAVEGFADALKKSRGEAA